MNKEFDNIEKKALSGFTKEEEAQLNALLSKIKSNMNIKDFSIVGTREGTIISALLAGIAVKLFTRKLEAPLNQILTGGHFHIPKVS